MTQRHVFRMMVGLFGFAAAGLVVGCSGESWDWFGMNREKKDDRPVTKARRPADSSTVAAADRPPETPSRSTSTASPDDAKAKEVDEKVERYVRSMNQSYDPNYESNDFRAKVRRQNDPARSERIRQTAAMSRDGGRNLGESDRQDGLPSATPPPDSSTRSGAKPVDPPVESPDSAQRDSSPGASHSFPSTAGKSRETVSKEELPTASKEETPSPERNSSAAPAATTGSRGEPSGGSAQAQPPVIKDISISAGESSNDSVTDRPSTVSSPPSLTPPEPATSPPPAPVVIDTFKKRLEEQESQAAKDVNNVVEQFKLRLMYLADGQEDKALAPSPGMNPDLAQLMQAQLRSLIAARSSAERDPALWANKQMESIEQLRNLVRSRADLSVPKVALCKEIISFGQFTPFEPAEFKAGVPNRVALYVEIDNFSTERTSSGLYRVLVSMRQSLMRKSGEELWNKRDENIEDLSRRPRRDFYLTAEHVIPKSLEPGEYLFKVEVEDVLAGKLNSNTVHFKLVP